MQEWMDGCKNGCKFCECDKRVIAKQCNGVAAVNDTSHAR